MGNSKMNAYPPALSPDLKKLYHNLEQHYLWINKELTAEGYKPDDLGYSRPPFISKKNNNPVEESFVSLKQISLPETIASSLFKEICHDFAQVLDKGDAEQLQIFSKKVSAGEISFAHLLEIYSGKKDLKVAKAHSLKEELFAQVMLFTLRPFISWIRDNIKGFTNFKESWQQNTCPLCGAIPELARLTPEQGKRLLFCWLCGTEWRFNRFTCLYCQENLAEGQSYFAVKDTPYRVDICDNCNHYLKVIDQRQIPEKQAGPLTWLENDLGTLHLDKLAEKEGYKRNY